MFSLSLLFVKLAERERAYAEARARILGGLSEVSDASSKPNVVQVTDTAAAVGTGIVPSNVQRQPRGPDGTRGFTVLRRR